MEDHRHGYQRWDMCPVSVQRWTHTRHWGDFLLSPLPGVDHHDLLTSGSRAALRDTCLYYCYFSQLCSWDGHIGTRNEGYMSHSSPSPQSRNWWYDMNLLVVVIASLSLWVVVFRLFSVILSKFCNNHILGIRIYRINYLNAPENQVLWSSVRIFRTSVGYIWYNNKLNNFIHFHLISYNFT